jgi:serine protease Do
MKTKLAVFTCFTLIFSFLFGIIGGGVGYYFMSLRSNEEAVVENNSTGQVKMVEEESAYIDVVEKTDNAVVSIVVTADVPVFEEYYYNPFGGDFGFSIPGRRQVGSEEQQIGAGSGFIVTSDGYIVTNKHVVSDAEAGYTVIFNDGEKIEAKVIDRDQVNDIAILKIDKKDLNYINMGNSDNIKVGQRVVAIGYALGEFSNTVSAGIISGLARTITAGSQYGGETEQLTDVIQTDASINPGNSGGPLLDLNGNAIGVNVAVAASAENIGFAIPINYVNRIVDSVKTNGKIIRPYIGVRYAAITQSIKENNNLKYDYGVIIVKGRTEDELAVIPGSPADKAGLKENDIILEINGIKLDSKTSLQNEIQKYNIGDKITLKVDSKGDVKDIEITLDALD